MEWARAEFKRLAGIHWENYRTFADWAKQADEQGDHTGADRLHKAASCEFANWLKVSDLLEGRPHDPRLDILLKNCNQPPPEAPRPHPK